MSDRWVCSQCSKANREDVFTCEKCGALRGVDTVTGAGSSKGPGPAPFEDHLTRPPSSRPRPERRRARWLGLLWIPALLVGFFLSVGDAKRGEDGDIASAGSMSVLDLRVGDCFDLDEDVDTVSVVRAVPCGTEHDYEMFAEHVATDGSPPSAAYVDDVFYEHCVPAFHSYVGVPYENSAMWADVMYPTDEGWSEGDRTFVCFLFENEGKLTGSMRGAHR